MKKALALLLAVILLVVLVAFDFILVPLLIKAVLSWFGIYFSFLQCLVISILINVITYGFRRK